MSIKITIGNEEKKEAPHFNLNIRKTLDGNFIVFDHPDVDIIIMPGKKKILALTNDSMNTSSKTYDIQNKLFKYLMKKGVINPESVHAGNVYGSLEATYPELQEPQENLTATDLVLLVISKWIEEEKPNWSYEKEVEEMEIDRLVEPPADETTPLGKVPHTARKGTNYALSSKIGGSW